MTLPFAFLVILASSTFSVQAKDPPQAPTRPDDETPRLKPPPAQESTNLTPTLLDRASATVSVITGADLQALGVSTFTDALRIVPGLEVQKISASESGVSVRSYSGPGAARQGILGLVDGRQVYNEFFGGVWWETIPVALDEIKTIEVIRGPSSFLYGPNAMHGLVNIVTKSPTDYAEGESANRELYLSMAGGSYAANLETLTYVKREGAAGLKVTIAHDDMEEFESHGDTKNKIFADLQFKARLGEGHDLQLFAGAARQKFDVFFPSFDILASRVQTATYVTRANEYYLKGNYVLFDQLKIQASWTRFEADGNPTRVYEPFSLLLDTGDVDLQYSILLWGSNRVTLGTGYRYTTFNTQDSNISNGRHATGLGWVFLQDDVTISRELFLTAGARMDDHSVAGITISPRAALVWEFVPSTSQVVDGVTIVEPGQSLRITASYGFREPSLRDLWFNMQLDPTQMNPNPGFTPRVIGNKELNPEEIRSFEIGYWGRPTPRLQAECSVYYNLYDHLFVFQGNVDPSTGMPDGTLSRHNVNREDTYGIELNAEYQLTHETYVFANYAYEVRRDRSTHDPIHSAPRNKANAGVRMIQEKSISGMLWMNFFDHAEFTDKSSGNSLGRVPSYTLVNAKIWYPIRIAKAQGRVFVQAFNLLNQVHREYIDTDAYGVIAMAGVEIAW